MSNIARLILFLTSVHGNPCEAFNKTWGVAAMSDVCDIKTETCPDDCYTNGICEPILEDVLDELMRACALTEKKSP